ncbi:MAG: cytochrome b/b6 domain-containing protein [Pseudomonadota bacterium]
MTHYPRSVQWLHWIMAAALVGMVLFGLFMGSLVVTDPRRDLFMLGHLVTGVALLFALGLRIRWRLQGRMPALPAVYRAWERGLAQVVHGTFYGLMLVLPLLGLGVWLLDPFVFGPGLAEQSVFLANLAGWLHWGHYLGGWLLLLLLVVHVIGAVRGQFSGMEERRVLQRMLSKPLEAPAPIPAPTVKKKKRRKRG